MSKKFGVIALMFLAVAVLSSCSFTEKSEEEALTTEVAAFASQEGNFSINFPGKPDVSVDPVETEAGSINMTTFIYGISDEKALMLAYSDMPFVDLTKEEAMDLLKGEKEGALGSFGVTAAEEEQEYGYKDYPGLYYRAVTPEGYYIVAQTYLVKTRLYQIEMLSTGGYPTEDEEDDYLASFKLLKE